MLAVRSVVFVRARVVCPCVCASERAEQAEKGVVFMGREGEGESAGTELRFTWGGRTPRCLRQGVNANRHGANRAGTRVLPPTRRRRMEPGWPSQWLGIWNACAGADRPTDGPGRSGVSGWLGKRCSHVGASD